MSFGRGSAPDEGNEDDADPVTYGAGNRQPRSPDVKDEDEVKIMKNVFDSLSLCQRI